MIIHLLIDWENERPAGADIEKVRGARYRLWILHGPQQSSFTADQVKAWQPLGKQVRFVQSAKAGKNALDLHIAFVLGEASALDRKNETVSCYLIVSKDKGFDALSGYLESRMIHFRRAASLSEALTLAAEFEKQARHRVSATPEVSDNAQRVIDNLRAFPKGRPRTVKRLRNHVATLLGQENSGREVDRVHDELTRLKFLKIDGTKPTYNL